MSEPVGRLRRSATWRAANPWVKSVVRRLLPPRARFRVRCWLLETPVVSELFVMIDPVLRRHARLTARSELLIDGYPRSANSYASATFGLANPDVRPVSHLHTPRSIERAVRLQVPTIVLVRDPRQAVPSAIQYHRTVPARDLIDQYIRYYERVEPSLDRVVVATFDQAITDFGSVIARCNARYSTHFARYVKTPQNEADARAEIDFWARASIAEESLTHVFPRPTPERRAAAEIVAGLDARDRARMARAVELYARIVGAAAAQA